MKITRTVSRLEGDFGEAFRDHYAEVPGFDSSGQIDEDCRFIEAALAGENKISPKFRITVGCVGEVFMNNRELLMRWSSIPTRSQETLFLTLQKMFEAHDIKEVELII